MDRSRRALGTLKSYIAPIRLLKPQRKRAHEREPTGFSDLPIELVLEISSYLPEIDLLCLALTCRSLLQILDGDKALQFSQMFRATVTFPDTPEQRERAYRLLESPRWQLLKRIEDRRWRICYGCFKLHRNYHFLASEKFKKADDRICKYRSPLCVSEFPADADEPIVGVARLCPCMEITFGDKMKISKALLNPRTHEYRIKNSVITITGSKGHHECSHEYALENGERATIRCKLTLTSVLEGCLTVQNEYHVSISDALILEQHPILLCPHRNLHDHISDLSTQQFEYWVRHNVSTPRPTDDGTHWHYFEYPMSCPWCQTVIFNAGWGYRYRGMSAIENLFVHLTTRREFDPGWGDMYADQAWYQQTETALENRPHRYQFERAIALRRWVRPY